MARFANDTGNVITIADLSLTVGPYEEFSWPGYDAKVYGPVAGCTRLDADPPPAVPVLPPAPVVPAAVPPVLPVITPAEETP